MKVGLVSILTILADIRKDHPLHGDSLDEAARTVIADAVPAGARLPLPDRAHDRPVEPARNAWLRIYEDRAGLEAQARERGYQEADSE